MRGMLEELLSLLARCIGPVVIVFIWNLVFFLLLGLALSIVLESLSLIPIWAPALGLLRISFPQCAILLLALNIVLRFFNRAHRRLAPEGKEFTFAAPKDAQIPPEKLNILNSIAFIINLFIDILIIRVLLYL